MANNPSDGPSDDFFEQILAFPAYAGAGTDVHLATGSNAPSHLVGAPPHMMLQLSSGDGPGHLRGVGHSVGSGGGFHGGVFPLELSLEQGNGGFMEMDEGSGSEKRYLGDLLHRRVASSSLKSGFRGKTIQSTVHSAPYPPAIRPRVRARRGQATDPHSIAERLRRERIAEKVRALQDLVPNLNKTDRAAMVDEIVDYVKFLRLQVKVLSMSRLGGAGAVAQLVTDIPVSSVEDDGSECGRAPPAWEKWSNDGTDRQVAKLMEENVGAAMQFLQSKALCIMPISLASTIYHSQPPKPTTFFNPESNNES